VNAGAVKIPYRDVFREREFRYLIGARLISQIGNQATTAVLAFATLAIGGGAGGVGLVLGAEAFSLALFLVIGGVLGDRFSRRRIMIPADLGPGEEGAALAGGAVRATGAGPFLLVLVAIRSRTFSSG
jgi:MFS family permease